MNRALSLKGLASAFVTLALAASAATAASPATIKIGEICDYSGAARAICSGSTGSGPATAASAYSRVSAANSSSRKSS